MAAVCTGRSVPVRWAAPDSWSALVLKKMTSGVTSSERAVMPSRRAYTWAASKQEGGCRLEEDQVSMLLIHCDSCKTILFSFGPCGNYTED